MQIYFPPDDLVCKSKDKVNVFKIRANYMHEQILLVRHAQSVKRKKNYLFQYKLSYRNETGTNHHGLLSTSVSCFKIFLRGVST